MTEEIVSKYRAIITDLETIPSVKEKTRKGYIVENIYERCYKDDDEFLERYFSL